MSLRPAPRPVAPAAGFPGDAGLTAVRIAGLVGNPRPESRTHGLARALTHGIARVLGSGPVTEVDGFMKISGSSGLLDDNPVQRAWRDVHAISSHVVMNWDVPAENFGRMEFGLGRNEAYPAF